MDPAFDRAGFEQSIHAEAFASGAEQRQQEDRQGVQQQEAVAPLRITDAQDAQAHPEAQVFGIVKSRFDRPHTAYAKVTSKDEVWNHRYDPSARRMTLCSRKEAKLERRLDV